MWRIVILTVGKNLNAARSERALRSQGERITEHALERERRAQPDIVFLIDERNATVRGVDRVKPGSRYYPLFERLSRGGQREVTLSFAEIEALLGAALPGSARAGAAWWSNRRQGAVQAAAWMGAGYHVVDLDLAGERVTFRKPILEYKVERAGDTVLWNGDLIKALRTHMHLTQGQFAEVLGVRQQTVSEWENGAYEPTRATSKHLARVAAEARFSYLDEE